MASLSCCCTTNAISTNASSNLRLFHHSKKLQFHDNSHSFGFLRFNETPLYSRVLTVVAVVKTRRENRIARHERIRKKVEGTTERPRLAVFKSNKHLYCQVIDDSKMHTLASASTIQKTLAEELNLTSGPTIEAAKKVGEVIAKACLEKGITKIAFDRGGFQYHGHIKALADSAREHGLVF